MNTSGSVLHEKIAKGTTAIVVALMFYVIVWVGPFIKQLSLPGALGASVAGAVLSLGVYKLVAGQLLSAFRNIRALRKRVLGAYFLEGTWVGHWISEGEHYFTLEYIDQSSGETKLVGREFDAKGVTRASWASDTMSIDLDRRQLVYAYTCKVFHRKHVHEGLGVFMMVVQAPNQPPSKLDGYAVDLIDGDRGPNVEWKISDGSVEDEIALAKAREIFKVPTPSVASIVTDAANVA